MHVCVPYAYLVLAKARKGNQILRNWTLKWLQTTMWMVEIKPEAARRATSVLNHSVISSVPKTEVLEHTLQILSFAAPHGLGPVLNVKITFFYIHLNIRSKVA